MSYRCKVSPLCRDKRFLCNFYLDRVARAARRETLSWPAAVAGRKTVRGDDAAVSRGEAVWAFKHPKRFDIR